MIVTLKKISGGESMRTDSITGQLVGDRWPEEGEIVVILNSDPLNSENGENMRMFNTSRIKSISPSGVPRVITTETGSVYLMEEVNDPTE